MWSYQLWNTPIISVYIVGIVISLTQWRKHPGVSLLSLVGCSMLLLMTLFPPHTLTILRRHFEAGFIVNVTFLFYAIAMGMIVTAIFIGRQPASLQDNDTTHSARD